MCSIRRVIVSGIVAILVSAAWAAGACAEGKSLKVLFLGDNGHHRPADRFKQLQPVMAKRGIELTYSDRVGDLNAETLGKYDALVVYANTESITPDQEKALLDYVASGKGFVPLHCASFCFLNSPKYIELVGAQFQRHGTGTFRTTIAEAEHPLMKGFRGFESWDETYVHTKHNEKDRTVLEYRVEGNRKEPWTWVRTHGKGRVFYTAWGHDNRTWGNAGFQNLVERGIRWAAGDDPGVVPAFADTPEMTALRKDVKPFEYVEAKVPFYPVGGRGSGQPLTQMQKPLDPAESQKHYVTPVGFTAELFATEPDIGKPICMNWDERGRLWIAETVDYPNEKQREGEGRDLIRICEDTDGDGRADKSTVFAQNLSIPTSLAFCRGGIIVHQAPHTMYLKDTDGDDKADFRKVLFTGWSTGDTHAGPSNLRYGHDNWYYGIVGYAGFRGTIAGEQRSFQTGFYRFRIGRPKTVEESSPHDVAVTEFEFLRNTNNNSWGVGLSEEGILFGSTANGNPSEYMPIANRYYEAVRGWSSSVLTGIADSNRYYPVTEKIRQVDFHGGFTAAAGHALYTARTYPPEYWNRTAFVTEPTGHLIATFTLQPNGAGFRSHNSWNLLASDDEWAAPIMAEVGPDGQVWVIDWYNYIVQHNPTPAGFRTGRGNAYETDLRDKLHGRVYRVVHRGGTKEKSASAAARTTLKGATPEQLVTALKNDNMLWRLHAQRLLIERGKADVVPALTKLAQDAGSDEIGLNAGAIHALQTLNELGVLTKDDSEPVQVATAALKHKSPGVRRAAIQVLPRTAATANAIIASGALKDAEGQVRLAAALALAEIPASEKAAAGVVGMLDDRLNVEDRWLLDAMTAAGARQDTAFLTAMAMHQGPASKNTTVLERVTIVAEHQARRGAGEAAVALLGILPEAAPGVAEAILAGWQRGWPKDKPLALDATAEERLAALFKKASPAMRSRLITLASRWGSKKLDEYASEIAGSFLALIKDDKQKDSERIAAAGQYVEFRKNDAAIAPELLKLITPRTSPELAKGLVEAVGRSEAAEAGKALLEQLAGATPNVRQAAVRILLSRADWTKALLDAAEAGEFTVSELSLDQKQSLAAHPDKQLAARAKEILAKGGGLPNADRQKVVEEFLATTKQSGNAVAGKEVYKKLCSKCHVHGSEGTRIGPDLTGMAVHPKEELLINIMDPSRSVEGNFRIYSVLTESGKVINGLLASESKTALELFDAEGKKQTVLREEVEEIVASTKSLMPEGFEKQLSAVELTNLLEFLAQRGKYVPIDLRKVATIVTTTGMFYGEGADAERLILRDWSPRTVEEVPFSLVDPQGDRVPNMILLYGPQGKLPPQMPKTATLPCNMPAKAIHLLSGVSGWGYPLGTKGSVTMIVRLHYADGKTEDHELKNGEHFADYIRRVDVEGSKFAFLMRGQQMRYLAVQPKRTETIKEIELVKGSDATAPVVMAVTVESVDGEKAEASKKE